MMAKATVVVSRKWNSPEIRVSVTQKEIAMEMDIETFLRTLSDIVGNPTFIVTKAQHLAKLTEATEQVIVEMKRASVHG
jgi:hypothetical protein